MYQTLNVTRPADEKSQRHKKSLGKFRAFGARAKSPYPILLDAFGGQRHTTNLNVTRPTGRKKGDLVHSGRLKIGKILFRYISLAWQDQIDLTWQDPLQTHLS